MPAAYAAYKVAAAHVAPVFLDTEKTVAKACSLVEEAARNGAALIAFPETYVPAFPLWSAVAAPIYNRRPHRRNCSTPRWSSSAPRAWARPA